MENSGNLELFKNETVLRSYLPSCFITAALPLRDVNASYFKRKYNNIELFLTGAPKVPYGKYARLLLSVLTTHAVINKENGEKEITLRYDNLKQLTDEMLLPKQRGKEVKEQLELFASSSFQYNQIEKKLVQPTLLPEYMDDKKNYVATKHNMGNIPFLKNFQYITIDEEGFEKETKNAQHVAFKIVLGEDFKKICQEHSIPINYTVYSKIGSPLGKDLYAWLVYRNRNLCEGENIFIPRKSLISQFIQNENLENKDLERSYYSMIEERIIEIKQKYYPELKIFLGKERDGITLYKSPDVITENDTRYVLITNTLGQ